MKYLLLHILFFIAFSSIGQVGIGTLEPDASLHIAGVDATIRLEGLNSTNNDSNDAINLEPVLVDANGTVLINNSGSPHIIINDASLEFINLVTVVANLGTESTTSNIYNYNFTLTARSFIEIKYGLSYTVYESSGIKILDGKARQIKNFFTIDSGNDKYGQYSQNYYNIDADGAPEGFYNRGFTYILLNPGTYTINFWANIIQGQNASTEVVFGGNNSSLKIRTFQ